MTAIALTIAGSDSSGGAGIQADLKTFSALGVYGASAITALTAQNTQGVEAVLVVPPDFVARQIKVVARDLKVGAVKIGMLATSEVIEAVAGALEGVAGRPGGARPGHGRCLGRCSARRGRHRHAAHRPLAARDRDHAESARGGQASGRRHRQDEAEMAAAGDGGSSALGAKAVLVKGGHADGAEVGRPSARRRGRAAAGSAARRRPGTPTAPAARSLQPLPPSSPKAPLCVRRWSPPRPMSRRRSKPPMRLRSARAGAPCIISTRSGRGNDRLALSHDFHPLLAETRHAQPQLIARFAGTRADCAPCPPRAVSPW